MNICKARLQEGKSKGSSCGKKTINDHGYCEKHLRNKKYDEGIQNGIRWCRFFFRGCNEELTQYTDDIVTCKKCLDKNKENTLRCNHKDCKFKAKENENFCGKHERDKYRLEEKEKGIRYCDIDRGCFTLCEQGMSSCKQCLEKTRKKDNERISNRKRINSQLQEKTNKRLCQKCGSEFEIFQTNHNILSTKCNKCYEYQKEFDSKRERDVRNYKKEKIDNIENAYKSHIHYALRRGYETSFNFDDYTKLVSQACYYCGYYNEKEAIGIDRINNSLNYTIENCVPCCETCNRIKHIYHPVFFVTKAKIVSKQCTPNQDFYGAWQIYYTRSINHNYTKYKKEAEKRKLGFVLTEMEWDRLIRQPCYLCGYRQIEGIGLDRFDNSIREYNMQNSKPCCGSCNIMKNDMMYSDFINHMSRISTRWEDMRSLEKIPLFPNPQRVTISKTPDIIRWTANRLYYAMLSDFEYIFINQYKQYNIDNEIQILKSKLHTLNNKEIALSCISSYLRNFKKS